MNPLEEQDTVFEQRLTEALCRVDAPQGFVERTMARTQPKPQSRAAIFTMPRPRPWASGAIAAVLLVGVLIGEQLYVRHQREAAELAQRQFDAAMRITDHALEHTREQLQRAGIQVGN